MTTEAFDRICDRIARDLDPQGHKDRRWAKDEGAKLDKVADLIEQSFAKRDDLQVQPTANTKDTRGIVLSLGQDSVARLTAKMFGNAITIWAAEVEGGTVPVAPNGIPGNIALDEITPQTVADAVAAALNRITT